LPTLAESDFTVASFAFLEDTDANLGSVGVNYTDAELLATAYNTNLVSTANLSEWSDEESIFAFEFMENATFATFDTFVGAKSQSGTYKLDGIISDIADFAVFTPAYQYDFLDGYSYFSLHWENDAGDVLEQTNEVLIPTLSLTTISLQDENDLVYGGSTDTAATLVFKEINLGDVTSEEVTQVVATDASFKVFEDALSTIDGYYVGDRIVNIGYVPVVDKEKLSYGDLTGALTMDQVLFTTNELGVDMVYNDGLVYTIENQQGMYGSLSVLSAGSYTDSYYATSQPFISSYVEINKSKGWQYILDNADPDTIALNPGEIGFDMFTVNVSDGINTSSMEIQISVTGSDHKLGSNGDDVLQGVDFDEYFTSFQGADVVYALAGNDTITLTADAVWAAGYSARNVSNDSSVGTGEKITLEGLNRFTDVIDGGTDIDSIILTSGNDAFFIDDVYSAHHSSLTLSSTTQGVNSTARMVELETINAGEGNDIVDLTSTNFVLTTGVTINGEAGNDNLWGSNGSDIIDGGTGDDSIFGGTGSDTLTGGTGADTFQFTATAGSDVITDFDIKNDTIELYYREGEDHAGVFILDETLIWRTSDLDENGIVNEVLINLSTSISKVDSAIVNASLDALNKETIARELQLFKETLSAFDILEPSDMDIMVGTTPSIDTYSLNIGDLDGALTISPVLYLETSLGTNVQYANGITYYIEGQQGIYGSLGFGFPLEGEFKISDISTGNTDLRSSIEPINEDNSARYTTDYVTMHLSNGFSNNWPTWYYVLDNNDVDTISATADSTHIDTFTISVTNGIDVVSQQIDVNIFEDTGLPFDPNTMLGQFQSLYSNDDYLYMDSRSVSVSLDDLNNFDPFITFVDIV